MTDAPITLMQDGVWLVDEGGVNLAMPVPGGLYLTGTVKSLPEMRALVAWLEREEVKPSETEAVKQARTALDRLSNLIGSLPAEKLMTESAYAAQQASLKAEFVVDLARIQEELAALRAELRGMSA